MSKGLLLAMMEPPAALEEEFNDWYDTEHFPQRRALPGFESAARYVCLFGFPRRLALYDLACPAVLDSDAYRAVSGPNSHKTNVSTHLFWNDAIAACAAPSPQPKSACPTSGVPKVSDPTSGSDPGEGAAARPG